MPFSESPIRVVVENKAFTQTQTDYLLTYSVYTTPLHTSQNVQITTYFFNILNTQVSCRETRGKYVAGVDVLGAISTDVMLLIDDAEV